MKSCVLLLNWNGWKDTLECLESVLRLNASEFRVVVCDNSSANGSLEKIKDWARGELQAGAANPQLSYLSAPPFLKPIPYVELTREQAESGAICSEAKLVLHSDRRESRLRRWKQRGATLRPWRSRLRSLLAAE